MKDQPNSQYIPFLDLHPSYSCIPLLRLENFRVNKTLYSDIVFVIMILPIVLTTEVMSL